MINVGAKYFVQQVICKHRWYIVRPVSNKWLQHSQKARITITMFYQRHKHHNNNWWNVGIMRYLKAFCSCSKRKVKTWCAFDNSQKVISTSAKVVWLKHIHHNIFNSWHFILHLITCEFTAIPGLTQANWPPVLVPV